MALYTIAEEKQRELIYMYNSLILFVQLTCSRVLNQ